MIKRSRGHAELYWRIYEILKDEFGYYPSRRLEGQTHKELDAFILKVIEKQGEPKCTKCKGTKRVRHIGAVRGFIDCPRCTR